MFHALRRLRFSADIKIGRHRTSDFSYLLRQFSAFAEDRDEGIGIHLHRLFRREIKPQPEKPYA